MVTQAVEWLQHPCGSLGMHHTHHTGLEKVDLLPHPFGAEHLAPGQLHLAYLSPRAAGHIHHAVGEIAGIENQHLVAWLHQIHQTGFHTRHTRGRDRQGETVFRAECLAQHLLDFVHDGHELRVHMTQ